MTYQELAQKLATAIQTTPELYRILAEAFENMEAGSDVTVTQIQSSGNKIASITVGEEATDIYSPEVDVQQTLQSGTEIAEIEGTKIYAPIEEYSTTERKIGKWIDNSDLYQKTIYIEHLPDGTVSDDWVFYNTGIEGTINVIEMDGMVTFANGNRSPIPYVLANSLQGAFMNQIGLYFKTETTQVGIMCGSDRSTASAYVTIKYTKATT